MRVGIVGCGLIGQKRAKTLTNCQLVACADSIIEKAQQLAQQIPGCTAYDDWQAVTHHPDVDIVIVATPHNVLAKIGLSAVSNQKHVLIEKPAAKQADELFPIIKAAEKNKVLARVGFNHRYHRAMRKAYELIHANEIGEVMFLRARYGHGGRLGYDKEWRATPEISGGGELIDQGVHLIDLARWYLGNFVDIKGSAHTYYWDMSVDDNAFLLLKTAKKQTAFLHVSCTEWKNLFSLEIYGKQGKLAIDGLGGSYGVERLSLYKMLPSMGPPETTIWEYPMADDSWEVEFDEFIKDIQQHRQPAANLHDAVAALKIVEHVYRRSEKYLGLDGSQIG